MLKLLASAILGMSVHVASLRAEDKPAPEAPPEPKKEDAKKEEPPPADYKESPAPAELVKAQEEGLGELMAKKYPEFLKRFIPPERLVELGKKYETPEKFVTHFAEKRGESMVKMFTFIKGRPCLLAPDGNTAYYSLKEAGVGTLPPSVTFAKINGAWFIKNK